MPGLEVDPRVLKFLKIFFGIPLLALGLVSVAMPPILAGGLVWRGVLEHRAGWVFLGVMCGAIYLLLVFSLVLRGVRALRARE